MLGVCTGLIFNLAFCLMIYITNGAQSPYYAGLNLIITRCDGAAAVDNEGDRVHVPGSLLMYVVACVANPTFFQADSLKMFAFSGFFVSALPW